MAEAAVKQLPTIVVTGTPGTGKSTLAHLLTTHSPVPLQHIAVGDLVKEKGLHEGFSDEWQSYIVDEDKLIDELEPIASAGGVVLDFLSCEMFPDRWVDLVVVLRCDHTKLWERLEKRNYALKKIQENNAAEIMEVVLEEARSSYSHEIIMELKSESDSDLEANVEKVVQWIRNWRTQKGFRDDEILLD